MNHENSLPLPSAAGDLHAPHRVLLFGRRAFIAGLTLSLDEPKPKPLPMFCIILLLTILAAGSVHVAFERGKDNVEADGDLF